MTLWDAYQLANRRRAALVVLLDGEAVRVPTRRDRGCIMVNGRRVPPEEARVIEVERA